MGKFVIGHPTNNPIGISYTPISFFGRFFYYAGRYVDEFYIGYDFLSFIIRFVTNLKK
jgi:hypothetical protein